MRDYVNSKSFDIAEYSKCRIHSLNVWLDAEKARVSKPDKGVLDQKGVFMVSARFANTVPRSPLLSSTDTIES